MLNFNWLKKQKPNPQDKDQTLRALELLTQEIEMIEGTEMVGGWVSWKSLQNLSDSDSNDEILTHS